MKGREDINMKKRIICGFLLLIISILIITTTNAASIVLNFTESKDSVEIGDEITLTIGFNEEIVAANFMINYDKDAFEIIKDETSNFKVADKNGKIACIYADISQTGTKSLSLKLKVVKATTAEFSIEDIKVRQKGAVSSFTQEEIEGSNTVLSLKIGNSGSDINENTSGNENTT